MQGELRGTPTDTPYLEPAFCDVLPLTPPCLSVMLLLRRKENDSSHRGSLFMRDLTSHLLMGVRGSKTRARFLSRCEVHKHTRSYLRNTNGGAGPEHSGEKNKHEPVHSRLRQRVGSHGASQRRDPRCSSASGGRSGVFFMSLYSIYAPHKNRHPLRRWINWHGDEPEDRKD